MEPRAPAVAGYEVGSTNAVCAWGANRSDAVVVEPELVTKVNVMFSACVGLVLAIATPVTYPLVLSKGMKMLLPESEPLIVPCESGVLALLYLKIASTPIFPVLATSAQPCRASGDVPGVEAKAVPPGASVPESTPGDPPTIGTWKGFPLSSQNWKV